MACGSVRRGSPPGRPFGAAIGAALGHAADSGIAPRFPFGHGLAYTHFAYSGLTLNAATVGAGEPVEVSVTVTNTGEREGSEVVQVYVHDAASSVFRPKQELAGFAKVRLRPGQSRSVVVTLPPRAFAYFDTGRGGWHVEPGTKFEPRKLM